MRISRNVFTIVSLLMIFLTGSTAISAQNNKNKPGRQDLSSFKIYFQTVLGTDKADNSKTSQNVSRAIERIKSDYSYTNYQVISTSYQQISNQGQIQSANIWKSIGDFGIENSPIFVQWNIGPIESREESLNTIRFRRFNFNAEIPILIKDTLKYRKIKYSLSGIRVDENIPTVFGSLAVPQSDETVFFVLTVKKVKP